MEMTYRIEATYYYADGTPYRNETLYNEALWLAENADDVMGDKGAEDYPFDTVETAREALLAGGWESADGMVYRRENYPTSGETAIAMVRLCGKRDDEKISVLDAVEILGVSKERVCQLCKAGQLDAQIIGGAWIIDAASVRERAANKPRAGRRW